MQKDKYALLDTDFISKMHIIQKDAENHLIEIELQRKAGILQLRFPGMNIYP